ncbi:DUF262 domain-containing protein [Panacibacter ginsenosidivorans]|uniref:DUF262 domain-containing protein n=1 Tax=Panacibacter ginsenosidivorans TaxID=1813871 RepID=A0A5B8VCI0_9BACT|nr:DUF262 domain-containing protein [Panacibacter ginsenosidivorans]QEC68735.1 DUF262 domain-containing protein [Panacibacter ginsenosidivorans]
MDNTTLITGKKYIKDIFSPEQFFNIPEYQRPYVWGEEQITALLEDVSKAMENDSNKEYFLGCMIWNTRNEKTAKNIEYTYQDILDGQQRFITLFLLHGVIRDISAKKSLKDNVQKRLVQEADDYNNIPARNRIEFEIRDDKDFLEKHIIELDGTLDVEKLNEIADNPKAGASIRSMASGILIMKKWWDTKLAENIGTEEQYLADFYRYLSTKVLALYLATPNNLDDAYNLFTVLNSRGLQLQVSDILRAQNLRVIENYELRKLYALKWSDFENSISAPYKGFDDFLWSLVFIKMKYRSDDNKSLTKAFEFMFKRNLLVKGTETLDYVGKYLKHYESITNGSITNRESLNLFGNINFILSSVYGSQYLTPLMHYRECFGDKQIIEFLIKIDNLFSVGWLLGRRQSQTRTFIILRKMDFYADAVKKRESTLDEAVEDFLNDPCLRYDFYDEEISSEKPINIEEFVTLLENEKWGGFSGTRVNKTRYLLLKMDLLMGNAATILQYNKDSSSVEHIMPQKIEESQWNIDAAKHKEWIHRLGNLSLIDKNKNSALSNKLFHEKKVKYQGAIETRANTNYIFITNPIWDTDAIEANHKRTINLLTQYYVGNNLKTFLQIKRNLNNLVLL